MIKNIYSKGLFRFPELDENTEQLLQVSKYPIMLK